MTSIISSGPPPSRTSIDSETSRALPAELPKTVSIEVIKATVLIPEFSPSSTIVSANKRACSKLTMKAPEPVFTSKTRASVPSAIFFDIIELAIRGIESTVWVTSRKAYRRLSAGFIFSLAAAIIPPISRSCVSISSSPSEAVQPGIASILSRVPPP